jgi:DMSO/TMAO reductase YedYZ molybdopterin-dependent catalytic subunit
MMSIKAEIIKAYLSGVTEAQIAEQMPDMDFDFDGMATAYAQQAVENIDAISSDSRITRENYLYT